MTKENFIKLAKEYLEYGFSIIPVGDDKKPLVKWEIFQHRKATLEEIEQWANGLKNPNLGIVTGEISGIVVVDVEDGGSTENLPLTVISKTGGGGFHFYYKYPNQKVKNAVRIKDKTDIRGDGGYVIAPPSLHKSGNYYSWLQSPKENKFADLPSWVLITETEDNKTTIDWQSIINKETTQGKRNITATKLVGKLLYHLPFELWETGAWPALKEWNLSQNNPPLSEKELRTTFESISKKERGKKNVGGTQTPQQPDPSLLEPVELDEALQSVEIILPGKKDLVLLALSSSISHLIDTKTPLWLMFVGAPSSAKTEVARMLSFNPHVFFLDALTENAFISGAKNQNGSDPTDLLPLLNGKCFVVKDFTTTLSQREETVRKILGDLTSIYDNSFSKHSPSRGTIRYTSLFSILGCVTPQALNRHQRYMSQIGPRFLFYRVPSSNDEEIDKGFDIVWSSVDSRIRFEEAQKKISAYSFQVAERISEISIDKEPSSVIEYLNRLAKFIARARGTVLTRSAEFLNSDGEKVSFYEPVEIQIEEPYRALLQLRVLTRALTVITGKNAPSSEELRLVRKVALSSMPADRSLLLSVVASEDKSWSAKEIADNLGISHKTALRQLDELVSLRILSKKEQGFGLANLYSVNESFYAIIYDDVEFMSSPTETQTPQQYNSQSESKYPKLTIPALLFLSTIDQEHFKDMLEGQDYSFLKESYEEGKKWLEANDNDSRVEKVIRNLEILEVQIQSGGGTPTT